MSNIQYLNEGESWEPTSRYKINDNFYTLNLDKIGVDIISDDEYMVEDSAELIPTQRAVKAAIERIPKGDNGDSSTVAVGTVTTLAAGEPATVENVGTENDVVLDFGIPKGEDGETDHNSLTGKQGGTAGEYYHLTEAKKTVVDNTSGTNTGDNATNSQYSGLSTIIAGKKPFHGVVARPVGASNPLPTNITTTTFTLGATANPVSYYFNGTLVNVTSNKSATLTDGSAGLYFVYFDAATGNILATKNFPGITYTSNVIIATVFWNGTNYGLVSDERHGYNRDCEWHQWAHNTVGTRYKSGITLTHNGGTGAAATFATTAGETADEDIQFTVNASNAFPTANAGRLLYQSGASTYAFVNTPATTPGYLGANNRPNYVNTTGYALTQMNSAVNRYINVFVYATQDLHTPIYFFTETVSAATASSNGYTNLANARAIPFPNLSGFGLSPELKPIYRLIWRADGVLQAIDTTQDDYRTVSSLPQAAGTTSTTASAVTFNPSGTISATTVQTALEEIDSEKASLTGTETLTNKRINPRLVTAASYTTDTGTSLDVSTCDQFEVTAQAGALKLNNPSGTPLGGQKLLVRIKDNGTARALTYDTQFRAMGNALPTTTVVSKTLYLGFIFNATDTKWDLIAVAQEA